MPDNDRRHALVGPPQLWKMKRRFQIDFLQDAGLLPEHFLFDIGCGTLRGGVPLIDYLETGRYFGLESRPEVLAQGLLELRDSKLADKRPCLILNADIGTLELATRFDYVWAFSVLIHMTDEIARDCLRFVAQHLRDGGAFFANVNIGTPSNGSWQGFPVTRRPAEFYRALGEEHGLSLEDLGTLADHGHQSGHAGDHQRVLAYSRT